MSSKEKNSDDALCNDLDKINEKTKRNRHVLFKLEIKKGSKVKSMQNFFSHDDIHAKLGHPDHDTMRATAKKLRFQAIGSKQCDKCKKKARKNGSKIDQTPRSLTRRKTKC